LATTMRLSPAVHDPTLGHGSPAVNWRT